MLTRRIRLTLAALLASIFISSIALAQNSRQVPVFEISRAQSKVGFHVAASIAIDGTFDQWNSQLTFTSTDAATGVLDIEVQAASVNTGSDFKNSKLKGDDFFAVDQNPLITFKSTSIEETGPTTFAVHGNFTIRGVTRPETLQLTVTGKGTGVGTISGVMAFDRKNYGMNSGIPFIRIANRVEVDVNLVGKRVSGPPLKFKD